MVSSVNVSSPALCWSQSWVQLGWQFLEITRVCRFFSCQRFHCIHKNNIYICYSDLMSWYHVDRIMCYLRFLSIEWKQYFNEQFIKFLIKYCFPFQYLWSGPTRPPVLVPCIQLLPMDTTTWSDLLEPPRWRQNLGWSVLTLW